MADEFGKSSGYGLTSAEFLKTVDSNPAPKTLTLLNRQSVGIKRLHRINWLTKQENETYQSSSSI